MQEHTVSISHFKTHCLRLFDDVQAGTTLIVTKRGKEVGRVLPPKKEAAEQPIFGYMKGTVKTIGDIISPLDEPWNALSD